MTTTLDGAASRPPRFLFARGRAAGGALIALALLSCHGDSPTGSAPGPPLLVDATVESGLDFVHHNGMTGELYFAEMVGGGGALFDYDRDGDLDLYLVQGHLLVSDKTPADALLPPAHRLPLSDRLYRNELAQQGTGESTPRFADVTDFAGIRGHGYGMGVAAGDYDGDGWADLYVTNLGSNQLWRNLGDGTFREVIAAAQADDSRWSVPALFFDYDRDGDLDLFVGNYVEYSIATDKRCRAATGAADYCGPLSYRPEPDRLLRNRGDAVFEDVSRQAGIHQAYGAALGAVAADFDRDGWLDLYVANDGSANQLWINQGDGSFRDEAVLRGAALNFEGLPEAGMGVDAADFDNDGDEDLVLAHLTQETNTLYRNDGNGQFEDATLALGLGPPSWAMTGFGAAFFDLESDGWLDLLVANGAVKHIEELVRAGDPYPLHQRNQLFGNRQGTGFEEVSDRALPALEASEVTRGAAFGDVDNDGDTDVVLVNNAGPARLLLNRAGSQNHWLGLELLASDGGPAAPGAWVEVVRAEGPSLWRRARVGGSYASASDPRVLVGLGESDRIEAVIVTWPDGLRERFAGLAVDRYHRLLAASGERLPPA